MGGGLLQQVDRDTMQFAMKASCVGVYDELRNVSKSPVDDKSKKSLEGQLELVKRDDMTMTVKRNEVLSTDTMLLEDVWNTGVLLRKQTFDEVRAQVG
jgi:nicotinamide phosphoribosyltransferase